MLAGNSSDCVSRKTVRPDLVSLSQLRSAHLTKQADDITDDLLEILTGLSQSQKVISSKFFYDEKGSRLFDQICELPEYYLTRTEVGIVA